MSALIRWDPFREMVSMRNWTDRFFDPIWRTDRLNWVPEGWGLALDVAETDDEYLVKASLPGINLEDLEVTYESNVLTIKGETRKEDEVKDQRYHLRERQYGSFSRSISLPVAIQAEKIEARYEAGILTLHLPKSEETRPKRIKVHAGDSKKLIEGKVSSPSKN